METGKPGLPSAPVHISPVAAQTEKRMDLQAPLTAVYIQTVHALPVQPPAVAREPATLHLAIPPLYSKETLPFLTLHIAGGLQSQPGLSLAAAPPAARPKSAGKHVCPHCGRDCMKPSVLEKHLRCHTGERPYPCTTCGVSFKTQSNLYKHKRTQAHARLSSESEQSSLSSLDSMSGSREICTSSLSLDERSEELDSMEKDAKLPAETTSPASTAKVFSVNTQGSALTPAGQKTEANESANVTIEKQRVENDKPLLAISRHLPLQRQEATLFSKQWESSVSRGKSQSHESTDSGFSESSDHYPSPGSLLPDHSLDSLSESTKEYLEETTSTQAPSGPGQGGQEPKYTAREQKTLEERISKLISENTAVVEDKQLENVRPRKTVLSKQGSIDLPMPYTYKDSFHFDMRISKPANVGLQRNRKPDFSISVPAQQSNTVEHAPLTRSNSLPFSVALLQPDVSSPTSTYHSDYVRLVRRESSGQINPTGFAIKPVNQHSSTHRPLVRQTAVDGNHATDGLFTNSSVEEACTGSLSCDGDICGEPSNRKFRRKKAQKFAYNKWYMYGGGTFKKLYTAEKGGDDSIIKGRKCSTNPEQEVVQGLPKRLSAVHNETVTTAASTIHFTSSSATVCHPGCAPAKLSLVSAEDFNIKTSQLHTSCSSLKTLSLLPVSSIGSLVSNQTDSMSRAEAGKMIDVETHCDSTLQLCGAHIPSDRKKLKTDEKMIYPLETETNHNTPTHPLPSVTGSAPQQDANLSYVNPQKNQKHTPLKAALFPTCVINANTPSVSTSPATSPPRTVKPSFLPKYQLKLPNAADAGSNPPPHVVYKVTCGIDGCTFTSALSPSRTEQTSLLVKTSERKGGDHVTSPLMQTCDIKNTNAFRSTQDQLPLPCTATTLNLAETSTLNPNATISLAVVHRQFSSTTITTTCRQNDQVGLCSTSIQQLPRPVASVVSNFSATPPITTANNQSSAAAITAFSQSQPNPAPPLSHTHLSLASEQWSPVNSAYASSNTPAVPCHIVPFDQMQPDAQNVFHVRTADLQICLQIISDEQLALIEPQIERQSVSALSQRRDVEAAAQEVTSVTMRRSNDGRDHQQPGHRQEFDQSESLPTLNMESIKPPLPVQFGKAEPNLHLTERRTSTQATLSAESTPPEALGLSLRPHKHSHVNTVTVTQSSTGDVMSTAALLKGEHPLSLNRCAEEHRRVSRGGRISRTLSGQHKLSVTSSTRSERLGKESQHKLKKQACNVGTMKAVGEASAYKSSRLDRGETHPPLQAGLGQASDAACADELSGSVSSFSINKCKVSRQLKPQASIYCSNPVESTLSEALNSSKHANMGCDREGPSQESESQDGFTSTHSEKQLVSSSIQVDGPKDIPTVLTSIQSPTAGLVEELQTLGRGESPGQAHSTDLEGRREDKKGGMKTDGAHSDCTNTSSADMTKPEAGDREVKVDSFKLSRPSEQHLSQTHSGMSEPPPQSKSNNLNSSASSSQTSLSNSPQPPLEMNNSYFSRQHWGGSSVHNQQTHISRESKASQRINAQAILTETPNAFSPSPSSPQQTRTFSQQDHKQSSISGVQPAHGAAGNSGASVSTSASTQHSQHSYSAAALPGETRASNTYVLDDNTVPPAELFTYPQPDDYHDTEDKAPSGYTGQSSNSGGADITNKYHSVFLCGQLHGYQLAECVTVSGVRPVQGCQDCTEDTSSSDDEGKLIIEL